MRYPITTDVWKKYRTHDKPSSTAPSKVLEHWVNHMASKNVGILALGENRYTGSSCGLCGKFEDCKKTKGVKYETRYCQWEKNKFEIQK